VGNISVGGVGKTPLVAWLAQTLQSKGYRVGIISRGYGGHAETWPRPVFANSSPLEVGDEPLLLAREAKCPLWVGPDRVAAAKALLAEHSCYVILSDDGLQHYALGRTYEIAVIDQTRGCGNGLCLPAGPLREPESRLQQVDQVIYQVSVPQETSPPLKKGGRGDFLSNGHRKMKLEQYSKEATFCLEPQSVVSLKTGQEITLTDFSPGTPVHAVAGIGNPERFFQTLEVLGLTVIRHPFPDHHAYQPTDFVFAEPYPVVMTQKDAVKCESFAGDSWMYLKIRVCPSQKLEGVIAELVHNLRKL
jgi:tetraacyldisaccharide 4'-kinase